jgi:hypothetical protein
MERTPMIESEADVEREEDHRVRDWQVQQLHRLGVSWLLAQTFATLVDWHEVANLVERGCPPELALAIVH